MKFLLATALAALLFYLSQGLDQIWLLAWFAPAPVLWLAYGSAPRWQVALASVLAFAAGMAFILQCYAPIIPPIPLALQALSLAPSLVLFPLAVLFAAYAERRLPPLVALFAFPACWTATEFLVALISPHGVFMALANSQISAPIAIQAASLFGLFAVSFLVCLSANAVALALHRRPGAVVAAALGLAICAANLGFGWMRLQQPQPAPIRVAALAQEDVMVHAFRADTEQAAVAAANAYATAIRAAAAQGARVVVTPEGGIVSKPAWDATVFAPLALAAGDTGALIVAGINERPTTGPAASPPRDLAIAFRPDGTRAVYAKRHLLPVLDDEFRPGHGPGLLGHETAMTICKDMDFPRTIRDDARSGIRLMAVPSGDLVRDGWMHGRLALLRGVENGFAVVRPANQGLLLISDAEGRILARAASTRVGMSAIIADVPPGPGPTLYTRIGDVFAWFCLGLTLIIGLLAALRPKPRF